MSSDSTSLFQRMFAQNDFRLDVAAFQQWDRAMREAPTQ